METIPPKPNSLFYSEEEERQGMKILAGFFIAAAVSSIVLPFWLAGRLPYPEFPIVALIFAGIPILIASCILCAFRGHHLLNVTGFGIVLFLLIVAIISTPIGSSLKSDRYKKSKTFCDALIPKLDEYKAEFGHYPADIHSIIPKNTKLPFFMRQQPDFYTLHDDGRFTIGFVDSPNNPILYCSGVSRYYSDRQSWEWCSDWGVSGD